MRAVLCTQWGMPDTLRVGEAEPPAAGPGEVRVAVHACGINFADTLIVQGKYQERPELPFSPGLEAAGVVLETGAGVTGLEPGQRVIALCGKGGLAEEAVAPAVSTTPIPDGMDFVTAAGFAVTYGTAHVGLDHRAGLAAGEALLVHGAAGGVGLAAVEIGKRMGATVIATASTAEKLELARRYGADHLIDYTAGEFREEVKALTGGRGADVIFDPVGGAVFEQSLRCIAWEGRILVIGFASGDIPKLPVNIALVKNFSVVGLYWGAYARRRPEVQSASLRTLIEWHARGELAPHVSATYPLERGAEAIQALLERRVTGKVVVRVRETDG